MLERRVVSEDDREIILRTRPFCLLLPEASPEPESDLQLEQLILERIASKVRAAAIHEVKLDALVAVHVELRKATTETDIAKLRAKERDASEERHQARRALEYEISRLTDLLHRRDNRRRALLVAETTK